MQRFLYLIKSSLRTHYISLSTVHIVKEIVLQTVIDCDVVFFRINIKLDTVESSTNPLGIGQQA